VGGADVGEADHPAIQPEVGADAKESAILAESMGLRLLLVLLAAAALQTGVTQQPLRPPLDEVKLFLPNGYEADRLISHKYSRIATTTNPDVVVLRMEYYPVKMPLAAVPPTEGDLMKMESALNNIKLTAGLGTWRGRQVPMARYEGFIQGNIGVYGRMVWLPLEPGTIVLHLYSEPPWAAMMNHDWDVILANIDGKIAEPTLRERAPGRWLASLTLTWAGGIVFFVGIIMIIARMNESVGGAVVYLGLFLPVVPLGYAFLHLVECWRALLVCASGLALFGVSFILER
jgi:hypothetical protein